MVRLVKIVLVAMVLFMTVQAVIGIDLSVETVNIERGEEITLDILVDSDVEIFGGQFDVYFDSSVLRFVKIEKGDFFESDGGSSIDSNDLGALRVFDGRVTDFIVMRGLGSDTGISGEGVIARVTFSGLNEGESEISLTNLIWSNANAEKIVNSGRVQEGKVIVGNSGGIVSSTGFIGWIGLFILFIVIIIFVILFYRKKKYEISREF